MLQQKNNFGIQQNMEDKNHQHAQWTVTGAGVAILKDKGEGPRVTSATIGRVIDMGLTDPFNMGGAMAPAAVDTIEIHLKERGVDPSYYDLIVTGDLAHIGREVSLDLLKKHGIKINEDQFQDCGLMIYREGQPVLAGASGAGCSASVVYGHLLNRMKKGEIKRMLVVATGALLSPLTFQQNETIPCIAHAVSIEYGGQQCMIFFWAFVIGGFICVIGQIMFDVFKLTPAHTLSTLVVVGAILDGFDLYEPLIDFAGAGATIPITSFGNSLVHGAMQEAEKHGLVGVITGMFEVTSSGISAAIIFGYIGAIIFKPKG